MNTDLILGNLLNAPMLFFALGLVATLAGTELELPDPMGRFFASFLLLAIGLRGGAELARAGYSTDMALTLGTATLASALMPFYLYVAARRRFDGATAAALAAAYGSVSAVLFACALNLLQAAHLPFSGYMNAALAAMEAPAIVSGVLIYQGHRGRAEATLTGRARPPLKVLEVLRLAFGTDSLWLLLGSLVVGVVVGEAGWRALKPCFGDLFQGVLCFFLLDQGSRCAFKLDSLKGVGAYALGFAIAASLVNALVGLVLARLLGLSPGNAFLFVVLLASSSYLAVPAAMREAIPTANAAIYVTLPLAVTFPFNVVVGLPLYLAAVRWLIGGGA